MSKSPSLRRIQADVRELALDPSDRYHAAPLESDMFEWHFTIRGAEGTDFEGGIYHGRILLPPEYPFKPPHIVFLTPSGRFETNTKVCLSFSAFHPELWQPAWGIRLILEALISFLPTPADGAIGALDWSTEERKRLAKLSQSYCCPRCGKCSDLLPEIKEGGDDETQKKKPATTRFAKEIAELQRLQQVADKKIRGIEDAEGKKESGTSKDDKEEDQKISAAASSSSSSSSSAKVENSATSAESINQEAPEEEIVFGAASPTAEAAGSQKDDEDDWTDTDPHANTTPDDTDNEAMAQAQNNAVPNHDDPSWMYDPLLNLMMILLAAICWLLAQKFQELMEELGEIQRLSDLSNS